MNKSVYSTSRPTTLNRPANTFGSKQSSNLLFLFLILIGTGQLTAMLVHQYLKQQQQDFLHGAEKKEMLVVKIKKEITTFVTQQTSTSPSALHSRLNQRREETRVSYKIRLSTPSENHSDYHLVTTQVPPFQEGDQVVAWVSTTRPYDSLIVGFNDQTLSPLVIHLIALTISLFFLTGGMLFLFATKMVAKKIEFHPLSPFNAESVKSEIKRRAD